MRVKSLTGDKPAAHYGGWWKFLMKHCELRDTARGVRFYGASNCNYILWPCGTLIQNFGYHGRAMMNRIRKEGQVKVLTTIKEDYRQWLVAYNNLCHGIGKLTDSLAEARQRRNAMRELEKTHPSRKESPC